MAGVVESLNLLLDRSEPTSRSVAGTSYGNNTKHPHVACAVMLYMKDRPKTRLVLSKAFREVVTELQSKSYLKRGTMESTVKGVKMARMLQRTEEYHELMDEYEDLLEKVRKGDEKEYKGTVPLR